MAVAPSRTKATTADADAEKAASPATPPKSARPNGNASGRARDVLDERALLAALRAVRKGSFSTRLPTDRTGIAGEIAEAFNDIVELNERLAREFKQTATVVGRDGRISQRLAVGDLPGAWAGYVESVNGLIDDLTEPTAEVSRVLGAVAKGDLSQRMSTSVEGRPVKGEFLRSAQIVNTMVDQLNTVTSEVIRVAREVGSEGMLGGQAQVAKGVAGTWKELTDSVNSMAGNLTSQVRNIADVTTAVANGDLSRKITADARGEILELKNTVNTMVDQLNSFASEVTRVAREVGSEGKLGGQANVKGVAGTWKDLTDSVNGMAGNLTDQVRNIAEVTTAVARGDLSRKITAEARGEILELKNTINTMVDQLNSFASEVTRVAREVGSEGKLGGQADVRGVAGTWRDLTDSVNFMAGNLTNQVRNIAEVTTAVANGDLSKKITAEARGEILELKNTVNTMVDQLNSFASEVTRVAREVGTEGRLGGQADVKGVAGTWKDLTDSVNGMAGNLTDQVRNIAEVTTAVARGDLSRKITAEAKGEILELKNTINTMVDQLNAFASEVTRVAREVGSEGKLGGQARVEGVAGTWRDLTDSVNFMASNLTDQVRNIAEVTTAVALGDLSKKITAEAKGEILELKNTINTMVDQLNAFASEVTRVAREVGSEGKLGGQAEVKGVAGTWRDLTDSVNGMAGNLTNQVRNIAEVTTAVANGDLSRKITAEARGEILELKNTINTMVDQLNAFASEVTRVAREVGSEGKLGGQADVRGVAGTWRDLTDSVNFMAGNLTSQVRNIAEVTTAVARGDLSKKITADARGEILELKNTVNTMVDQLNSFASEVTRVAREVGTEGKLGGQARVEGVAGTWRDLTDSVNGMAGNLTDQVRNIAEVTTAVANGDLSRKITAEARGEILELKNTINTMVDQLNAFAGEVTRVAREVGTEGKLGGQANVRGVAGTWKDLTDSVNGMAGNLTNQVRNIAEVTTAVANGDLSKKITAEAQGEILELKNTINTMVDQLNSFASEVTRVAREVGTEGRLGGQAQVRGVAGTWRDLTDNVNQLASNLTEQVRGIAQVVTAVANGDLKRKLNVEARGEVAALGETINSMIDTLATFADQVTTVAREVGIEGRLGGQANVPGAAGTWRDLTDNVNQLAASLTTQLRAIGEVATAVTKGDLSRSIQVQAQGEVEILKDNINEMIRNLRETTQRNEEQDWLKTNLARFTGILQGQRDLQTVGRMILSELAPLVNAQHGVFYLNEPLENGDPLLRLLASYAYRERKNLAQTFRLGEGLVGQCAFEKERILLTNVPGDYIEISSGLGAAAPLNIVVLPILFEGDIMAVIELASFNRFSAVHLSFLDQLTESIGIVLNTIAANMRTEGLLKQSQSLTQELQQQQEELQQTNEELEEKARLLAEQNEEVERRRRELEEARRALEQKAEQLALTSKYKSQFLANMSHELRTPLNSLLILSQQLADNPDGNLSDKQVQFASTIRASGNDLLTLINDILDLSKIESGTTSISVSQVPFAQIREDMERTFRQVAVQKALDFGIVLDKGLPRFIETDVTRLQQVLKNLLSNAFKFTDQGGVTLRISQAKGGWSQDLDSLNRARGVIAFEVTDTGIGIPEDKQRVIFEAFQQADMETSRRFGGTGLGLSISREIAQLLGGEIKLESKSGEGSTFILYLPQSYTPSSRGAGSNGSQGSGADGSGQNGSDGRGGTGSTPTRGRALVGATPSGSSRASSASAGGGERPSAAEAAVALAASAAAEASASATASLLEANADDVDYAAEAGVADDRATIQPDDRVVLIIEDDATFAGVLLDMARSKGFRGLVALKGDQGLTLARRYKPDAITLDLKLPELDGWNVLDLLKHDPETRHIPVHVISATDEWLRALEFGAIAHLTKPVTQEGLEDAFDKLAGFVDRKIKNLLVVEDNDVQRNAIIELIGNGDVHTTAVRTAAEALAAIRTTPFECVVLDIGLPDMSGFELIRRIKEESGSRHLPIIVYTGKELTKKEETQLRKLAETIIVKDAKSPERLLDETALFLHRVEARLPEPKRKILRDLHKQDPVLEGKKVLIVDDDIRNIFALTSALERYKMGVAYAESGKDGIETLEKDPQIDVVLMDIMMPEMDGFEAIRRIRERQQFKDLPIIALTAKAMKGDREKCIEAGASDYITKPVDVDQLLSLLRVWLYR